MKNHLFFRRIGSLIILFVQILDLEASIIDSFKQSLSDYRYQWDENANVTSAPDPSQFYKALFGIDTNEGSAGPGFSTSWFKITSYTLAWTTFGLVFMSACAATAYWYVVFVITDPAATTRSMKFGRVKGKRIDIEKTKWHWNLIRIARAISLALDTFDRLDLKREDCQKKILCESQENRELSDSSLWQIINRFLFVRILKTFSKAEDYEVHLKQEKMMRMLKRSDGEFEEYCETNYQFCEFSLRDFQRRLYRVYY